VRTCKRVVEYDGTADSIVSMRRRNKKKEWLLFTRGLIDKLISFIITGRTTYTAATRHLSADVHSFTLRRQDVVKLGTAAIQTFRIPPETGRCPICGPNPEFIVIDAQSLGCTDPESTHPFRPGEDCPVLDIPAAKLCIVETPALRAAVTKVLRTSAPLTTAEAALLRGWHKKSLDLGRLSPDAAGAAVFFRFFPLGVEGPAAPADGAGASQPAKEAATVAPPSEDAPSAKRAKTERTLESALRLDADGNVVLGGKGAPAKLPMETWRDRKGLCAPNFGRYPRVDDGVWICVRPFLQAMLTEAATSMFQRKDERRVSLLANTMRLHTNGDWREVMDVVDDIGFLASFLGRFADEMDDDVRLRKGVGELLLAAVAIEQYVDTEFEKAAKNADVARGWRNTEYCRRWKHAPTLGAYKEWRAEQEDLGDADEDDPLISYEFFASLPRVRPGITDSEAAKRRVGYKGKDRHVADFEGDGDACGKAFSVKTGLTQGVFNVVCPHVITYGFRCLFEAESVGDALSIVLERFPKLPRVIFYDVACKIDKNSMRRVRPIFREQGVRCILDRPHSITHTCSPVYMPDESLGTTSGVATQAAEVSHSISVVNRTSLAYMSPTTYMAHRMVQVAFMNLRKIYRLHSGNATAENDHVRLAPFFHAKMVHQCERISVCACDAASNVVDEPEPGYVSSLAPAAGRDVADGGVAATGEGAVDRGDAFVDAHAGQRQNDEDREHAGLLAVENTGAAPSAAEAVPAVSCSAFMTARSTKTANMALISKALGAYDRWVAGAPGNMSAPMATPPISRKLQRLLLAVTADCSSAVAVRPVNKGRITLMLSDLQRLCGASWLDDELMNSFVALINDRDQMERRAAAADAIASASAEADASRTPRTRMFNTFFYSRLSARVGCYDYSGVRKWGVKVGLDLEDVDTILVPINLMRTHWVLVAISVKDRKFHYYDSFGTLDTGGVVSTLRRWLDDEVRARLGADASAKWGVQSWPLADAAGLPEQFDGGSCGVFVLAAADCFSLGQPLAFAQEDMVTMRHRVALALFFDDLRCSAGLLDGDSLGFTSSDDDADGEDAVIDEVLGGDALGGGGRCGTEDMAWSAAEGEAGGGNAGR